MLSRTPVLTFTLFFIATSWRMPATAQNAAPMPHSPDLLGIYIGMSAGEAKAQLQKQSSDVYVQYDSLHPEQGFGLTLQGEPYDQVSVFTTLPPNAPAVWRVERTQMFSNQKPLLEGALVDALRKRYGKETLSRAHDNSHPELYWIFDANGRLRSDADPALMACSAAVPNSSKDAVYPQCVKEFFGIYVLINGSVAAEGDVQSYRMVLVNYPYAMRASNASQMKQAEDAQRQPKKPTETAPTF